MLQHFTQTPHEPILASVLATAEDHSLTAELVEAQVRDGLARWWQQARRTGGAAPAADAGTELTEEGRRLRQLDFVRQTVATEVPEPGAPAGFEDEGQSGEWLPTRDII